MKHLFFILLLMPFFALAEVTDIVVRTGNGYIGKLEPMRVDMDNPVSRSFYNKYASVGDAWYSDTSKSGRMVTPLGARATSTMPVIIEHKVSKKAVMKNLFGKVSTFAKNPVVGRLGWVGMGASFVIPYLIDEFYLDEEKGEFVAVQNYYNILYESNLNLGYMGEYSSLESFMKMCNERGYGCKVIKSSARGGLMAEYCKGKTWNTGTGLTVTSDGSTSGGRCYASYPGTSGFVINPILGTARINVTRTMSYDDFEGLVLPHANADPSPFVNYSRDSQNSAPAGFAYSATFATANTTVNTSPYTDPVTGKAKQTTIIINEDGKSATMKDLERPDLDGQTDVAPIPTPVPDSETGTETETKPDTSASTPVQCDIYPDSLGCVDVSDASEPVAPVVPEENVNLSFQPDNVFSNSGQCPAPETFDAMGNTFSIDTTPLCTVAEKLRPFLIAIAWLTAAFFVLRTISKEV